MGKPRYWWYPIIKKAIRNYNKYADYDKGEYKAYSEAINKALKEIEEKENAEARKSAIVETLFNGTKECDVALQLNYSKRMIQKWENEFIRRVGKLKGF